MSTVSPTARQFRERLVPGPGLLAALAGVGLLLLIVMLPVWPTAAWVAGVAAAVVCVGAAVLRAPLVEVAGGELRAGRAHVPAALLGDVVVLATREQRAAELGARLDARAHVVLVSSVPTAVRVALHDPADPTPYWIVSSRRPEELAAALRAQVAGTERGAGTGEGAGDGPGTAKAVTPEA
ncbi:DUF3093 domain-containing protein [Xylanimonas protaetiae]|uniref:DUF3093 domain-containing protein n=1 Tax=Xylanimonas protaetiae TaxID=2509457 RepID=A0A4P6F6H7_9MICO|nr:DUF3093 domain-containing protein [Xylanimonas protaetiae]QAY71244.1 DUF3093 domain-containing protein [Xylanimonas protaetiae]